MKCSFTTYVFPIFIAAFLASSPLLGQTARINTLENVELKGTHRISVEMLQSTLRLKVGDQLTDEYVTSLRSHLLGLGLFKDAIFSLRKGSEPGRAVLVVTAFDDESVLSTAAMGGEFSLLVGKPRNTIDDNEAFRSYRFGLIARNLMGTLHRAALVADIDAKGTLAMGTTAYGLPRFAAEGVQFDAAVDIVDPEQRFIETQAFGMKVQSLWTRSMRFGDFQYGLVWYSNTHRRYRLDGWQDVVTGPKIGLIKETRFLGFMPSEGWRIAGSLIPALNEREKSVTEWQLGGTWIPTRHTALSSDLKATTVARHGVTTRAEIKLDVPITDASSEGTKALVFSKLRYGQDHYENWSYSGSDAILGIRYYSTGFIGELAFQITQKNPLEKPDVPTKSPGDTTP